MSRYPEFPPGTPSVTEILQRLGLIDSTWFTPEAAERGTRVHRGAQLLVEGNLDWQSVDPGDSGYLHSLENLLESTGWIVKLTEQRRYDDQLKFCGTFDAAFNADIHNLDRHIICDYKTGAPQPWHEIQLGFYWRLAGSDGRLAGIYLQQDGSTAKLKFYNAYNAWHKAQTVLNFYRLKENL